jgi:hypothetical protein
MTADRRNETMHADVDHLRLFLERWPDHWAIGVQNRINGAWLYRAQCTSERIGRDILVDFASSELVRTVVHKELHWAV